MWVVLPPSMSSACARASADSTSDLPPLSNTVAEALASSASLSGKLSPPQSWQRAWKKAPWMRRLSGVTCEPSMATRGVESWIALLRDTRASRSASRASNSDTKTPAISGPRLTGSSARSGRVLFSLRTWQRIFVWASPPCAEICKTEATAFRQDYSARLKSAQAIAASGFSSWPTARANESQGGEYMNQRDGSTLPTLTGAAQLWRTPEASVGDKGGMNSRDSKGHPHLCTQAFHWPTPNTPTGGRVCSAQEVAAKGMTAKGKRQVSLESATKHWPTPVGTDGGHQEPDGKRGLNLRTRAQVWPTPTAQDSEQSGSPNANHLTLHRSTANWASPAARDWKSDEASQATLERNARPLSEQVCQFLPLGPTLPVGPASSPAIPTSHQRLNPVFTCWLMGLPWFWTQPAPISSARREMESYRSALRSHLSRSLGGPQ
jgi:hypothetical protein